MSKPIVARLPHEGHEKHLCYLENLKVELSEIKKFVKGGKYICKNCYRVANDKEYLCNPEKI